MLHKRHLVLCLTFWVRFKAKAASEVLQKMHPVRSQGALIVRQQPLLFSEGTHPLREGACRKKHISSEQTEVRAASCERTFEVGPTSVGGVLEGTKNIPNLQVFGSKNFDYILCI